jgi:hypothetical protein
MAYLRSAVVLAFLALSSVSAFAPTQVPSRSATALQAKDNGRKAATSFFAAAFLFANVVATAPATAWELDQDFSGSSQVIAGRSGGRAGGRSSRSSSSYRSAPAARTTVIQQRSPTVIVAPAPVIIGGGYGGGYGGYGYNPLPGLAFGAVNGIGEGFREARQEGEIRDSRNELTQARIKEAELEARLKMLENAQAR